MCESKKRLRAVVRDAGKAVGERERDDYSEEVIRRIENSPIFSHARVVAVFSSLPDEVRTDPLLKRWGGKKRLALPSIEHGRMVFREYVGEEDLVRGGFGIMSPYMGRIVAPEDIEVMLVPGVAFDRHGNRLGRGGGFYDKYLSMRHAAAIHKIGICMPHQLVSDIPSEPHDVRMDEIVAASFV